MLLLLSRMYQAWGAGRSVTSKEDKKEVGLDIFMRRCGG